MPATKDKIDDDQPKSPVIIVFGASGDLAKSKLARYINIGMILHIEKTFPALFGLYKNGYLGGETHVIGFARSEMEHDEFIKRVTEKIKLPSDGDKKKLEEFKKLLQYRSGQYDSADAFVQLAKVVQDADKDKSRIYYLALPPTQFYEVSKQLKEHVYSKDATNQLIVEKPFGRDLESSNELSRQLEPLFTEQEIFRIDHYLGKEMVKNLMVMKFANVFFSAIWNRQYISNVQITFKESFGTEGRGGYFDEYGIIRDVVQNHLLQVLSVIAMERPVTLDGEAIRDEKVRVLKCISPIKIEETLLGQYTGSADGKQPGYLDDKTVPKGSKAATFAAVVLYVQNERWANVPFIVKAGKALNELKSEIRIQFADVPGSLFPNIARNELVIRVQPNEAIYMKFNNKQPGLGMDTVISELDLSYNTRYQDARIPDAYEALLLDILHGDKTNFVRNDELEAAWKIFTPLLHKIESDKVEPKKYEFGSRGPEGLDAFVNKYGFQRHQQEYNWSPVATKNKL